MRIKINRFAHPAIVFRLTSRLLFISAYVLISFLTASAQSNYKIAYDSGKSNLVASNYNKAIQFFSESLLLAKSEKDGLKIGDSYIGIGIGYDKSGDYQKALSNFFDALKAYESINNVKKQAGTLKNIGNTFRTINTYNKSEQYLRLAFQKYKQANDTAGLAKLTNDLGLLHMNLKNFDTAIVYFKKIATEFKAVATTDLTANALNNLGICYSAIHDYVSSEKSYKEALIYMRALGSAYGQAMILANLGELYLNKKQYQQSLNYSKQAIKIAQGIGSTELISTSYQNLATAYRRLGEYKQSNFYLDSLLAIKDTLFEEKTARSYAELETKYQNEKKQKEILLLKKDNSIKDLELSNQRRTRNFLLLTLALILVIAALILRSYFVNKRLNTALNIANNKLNEANQSKVKLLSILTHDLRTPISSLFNFIQLQRSSPDRFSPEQQVKYNQRINDTAENVLSAMEDVLIWSKGQMESFQPSIEPIEMTSFCEEMIELNSTAASNKNIAISFGCSKNTFLSTDLNFLKIAVRNLISNAIKFTPPNGAVTLTVEKEADQVTLKVKDNGPGISNEQIQNIFNWNSIRSDTSGLGLRLAKEFTEKLNGKISVFSEIGKGTEFIISFP